MVKVQGQTAGLRKNVVCLISLDLFAGKLQWMPLESRQPLLMFSSHGQRSRSRLSVFVQLLSAQYLLALCLKIAKLCTVDAPGEAIYSLLILRSCY